MMVMIRDGEGRIRDAAVGEVITTGIVTTYQVLDALGRVKHTIRLRPCDTIRIVAAKG